MSFQRGTPNEIRENSEHKTITEYSSKTVICLLIKFCI